MLNVGCKIYVMQIRKPNYFGNYHGKFYSITRGSTSIYESKQFYMDKLKYNKHHFPCRNVNWNAIRILDGTT